MYMDNRFEYDGYGPYNQGIIGMGRHRTLDTPAAIKRREAYAAKRKAQGKKYKPSKMKGSSGSKVTNKRKNKEEDLYDEINKLLGVKVKSMKPEYVMSSAKANKYIPKNISKKAQTELSKLLRSGKIKPEETFVHIMNKQIGRKYDKNRGISKKTGKAKRKLSNYQAFVKHNFPILMKDPKFKSLQQRDRMSFIAQLWNQKKMRGYGYDD